MIRLGDRVKVVSANESIETIDGKIINGMKGTVKYSEGCYVGVEFDDYIGGHFGIWDGKNGYCWYLDNRLLKKIEDTEEEPKEEVKEETKIDTLERKILTALREAIGVEIGEKFDVYENGKKQWTCKFEETGFFDETNGKFRETGLWKNIIGKFHKYKFKKKPFIPKKWENYWSFKMRHSPNGNKSLVVKKTIWDGLELDYGMLALGNVFRTKEEALKGKDKLLERLNELLKGE